MVVCHRCGIRPATIPTTKMVEGRQVYVPLCSVCHAELQKKTAQTSSILDKFGRDLTQLARDGKLDPVIGRSTETQRVIHILSRRTKNNPVLIGEPGVGKTAIAEGLAQKIISGAVPEPLRDKQVFALDLASVIAGTSHRGMFERRLKDIIDEVVGAEGRIILFLDEVHNIIGMGSADGAMDAANILKPALARGELQMVAATTIDEYHKYIEKDAALERRFQPVIVSETTVDETFQILKGLQPNYEIHHKVRYTDEALHSAVELSNRYINDRFLPDKAIDLMDEAGAYVRLANIKEPTNLKEVESEIEQLKSKIKSTIAEEVKETLQKQLFELEGVRQELIEIWTKTKLEETPTVMRADVVRIVSTATGIPLEELSIEEKARLMNMEEMIHERIVNQSEAVKIISEAIRRARAGLKDPKRPIGSFLFMGPTGVGKTELSKALAEVLYGNDDLIVRLDMSEYMEKHSVSKMIGAPPGYIGYDKGGQLTDIVRRKPFSIILLDEVEKAHPDVFNTLLQIMEDGRLTDSKGRKVDFKNTIIIMTSNIGSEELRRATIGFNSSNKKINQEDSEIKSKVMKALKDTFKPEFLNRIDEIVLFKALGIDDIKQIVDKELAKTQLRLNEYMISLDVTPKAKEYLAENGYSEEYGARPVKRLIQKEIENVISQMIIESTVAEGDTVKIGITKGELDIVVDSKIASKVGS